MERAIAHLSPDVAVIIEAVGWRTKKRGQALAKLLGGGEAFYCRARSGFDLAIVSKAPSRNAQDHREIGLFHGLLSLEVGVPDGGWLRIHATHLSPVGEDNREREVRQILRSIGPRDGLPEAILGDLNGIRQLDTVEGVPVVDVPPSAGPPWRQDKVPPRAIDLLGGKGWIDLFRELHPKEAGYTFPAHEPVARYDYVFARQDFRSKVTGIEVLRSGGWPTLSDHLPLLLTLA